MSDKDTEPKSDGREKDEPDLIDLSTAELDEYAEASTRERTPVVTRIARAEDADEAEIPARDNSEPPD